MQNAPKYQRPPFAEALKEWQKILTTAGHPTAIEWILDENLVFEKDAQAVSGVRLSFQTRFTERPADLAHVTYEFFHEYDARLVFYRLGSAGGKSVCLLLCDPVFETRSEADGFMRHDSWLISFCPGLNESIEEVTDEQRWKARLVKGRPLSDVDFGMPLTMVRELEAHGRVLTPYERFGVKIMDVYQRWQRASGE